MQAAVRAWIFLSKTSQLMLLTTQAGWYVDNTACSMQLALRHVSHTACRLEAAAIEAGLVRELHTVARAK